MLQAESHSEEGAGPGFETIAEMIVRDLQSGLFAPGQWLKQVDLETRYRAKRIEVRRALDRLAEKRVVQHLPNRGYHVYPLDDKRAAEIRDLRVILEIAGVDGMIASAGERGIEEARRLAERFATLVEDGTLLELNDANLAFHMHFLELCPNEELVGLVKDLRSRLSSAPAGQWHKQSRIAQSSAEHFEMVAALAARDGARLKAVIAAHIRQEPLR